MTQGDDSLRPCLDFTACHVVHTYMCVNPTQLCNRHNTIPRPSCPLPTSLPRSLLSGTHCGRALPIQQPTSARWLPRLWLWGCGKRRASPAGSSERARWTSPSCSTLTPFSTHCASRQPGGQIAEHSTAARGPAATRGRGSLWLDSPYVAEQQ